MIRDVPTVSLPILVNDKNPLHGACKAAIAGAAIINDVSQIEQSYQDFGRDVRDKEHDFFLKDSVHLKSYVSVAIPKKSGILIVLQLRRGCGGHFSFHPFMIPVSTPPSQQLFLPLSGISFHSLGVF